MLQYTNLSYQGNTFDAVDLTGMEYVHFDVWTADMSKLELSLIDTSVSTEKPVVVDLVKDEWNSIDIPISSYTDQGQPITAIDQLKWVDQDGDWGNNTVFIDNIYFYKASEVKLPIRFDQEEKFAGVGGASVELSTDPDDATNNTAKVTNGGNDWETAEIMLDVPITISSGGDNKYSVRIYSPDDADHALMMKLEESGANEFIELSQPFKGKGWKRVHFDMSTVTAQAWPNPGAEWDGNADFKKLVFFVDGGSSTPGVYHFDNIVKRPAVGLPIDFSTSIPFAGVGGAAFEFSADPDDATNATGKVTNGGNDWETAELILDHPISIVKAATNTFTVKIYSPDDAAHALMMKLEQSGANEYIELSQPFQGKGWNTVTFDMSTVGAQAWPNPGAEWDGTADFKKLVFFIDGGSSTPGVYHLDDIIKN